MTRPGSRVFFCVLGLAALLVVFVWQKDRSLELQVNLVKENKTVLALPIQPGERFTIHYFHSVENAPIWETHSLDKTGKIYIEEERYEKFGAGMGKMPGVGRMVTDGKYEMITDMHMPVGDFILRVGSPGVDHTILWRNRQFNLSKTLAHKAVQFTGRPVNLFYYLWQSWRLR